MSHLRNLYYVKEYRHSSMAKDENQFLFILSYPFLSWVQRKVFIQITGKLLDVSNAQELGYATVKCDRYSVYTLTNLDGEFIYKLTATALNESVAFSYLGYKQQLCPLVN